MILLLVIFFTFFFKIGFILNHRAIARLHYLAEDAVQVSVSHCDLCLIFVTLLCYVFKFMINMVRSSAM